MSRVITRFSTGLVQAYDFSTGAAMASDVVPTVAFPVTDAVTLKPDSCAVAPDLSRAVYATPSRVNCIDRDGATLWQLDFPRASSERPNAYNRCDFSLDGTVVWVYRPDGMARSGADKWLAVDAGTGQILAQADLGSVGHGGEHIAHPDGVHMLLDVGEGQDGTRVYRGRLDGDRIEVFEYEWGNRVLVSMTSDGSHVMTVDHDNADAAFHTYPDGVVVAQVPIEALGFEPLDAFIEYAGGYVDDSTAVVTVAGETEDEEEWFHRYLVDPYTGEIRRRLDAPSAHQYDFEPLGDGSWLSTTDDGRLRRHTLKG
ncbi:hypothetical protein KZZ52_14195 [Dactylosporangium sp. AC04546]|uniref:hypothetical protein n=1 Tax=Dactylosporangium sp. AC04546 TaxID=2862460 RepID=UPI001EDD957D|nr:hypothetical protein [Dactylosporangium sp. AC04546]WVK86472.1 hypothetical protein KZZ52_14195 [Dactylosporangium sp. AC04546]